MSQLDVHAPVEEIDDGPLYAAAKKVYPRAVAGFYRQVKWAVLVVRARRLLSAAVRALGSRPQRAQPGGAASISPHRRFYFFFIELWPQEVYYFTGLLIIAALTLFLMNAVAGRVWCGYMCPQTVWTDLFFAVERWVEGDRRERMRKDKPDRTIARWRPREDRPSTRSGC